jgi:uncharacterized protein YciI
LTINSIHLKESIVPLHAVLYRYADAPARLDEHRPAHKDYLAMLFEQGRIVISGPLTDGAPGALLIMLADDANHVAALLDKDPFWSLGLILHREIRCWSPFFGANRLNATAV